VAAVNGMMTSYAGKDADFQAPSIVSGSDQSSSKWQVEGAHRMAMVNTEILRQQHDAALLMADRLVDLVDNYDSRTAAIPILMQINRLLGILRVHLAHEDVELYPKLIESSDPEVARTAATYVAEMGSLAMDLEWFAQHWSCSASIAGNIDEFREGVHQLVLALAVRIERENRYLYPLAESDPGMRRRDAA